LPVQAIGKVNANAKHYERRRRLTRVDNPRSNVWVMAMIMASLTTMNSMVKIVSRKKEQLI
jgi:hypothetical protein